MVGGDVERDVHVEALAAEAGAGHGVIEFFGLALDGPGCAQVPNDEAPLSPPSIARLEERWLEECRTAFSQVAVEEVAHDLAIGAVP